jgi:hypothetical protein
MIQHREGGKAMNRKDTLFFVIMLTVALLLAANLFRPTAPHAYETDEASEVVAVSIASSSEESAWVVMGNKVYYVSLKQRSQIPSGQRTINVIDSQNLE